jgi:hypothetical protein
VDCSYLAYKESPESARIPPTELVDYSYLAYKASAEPRANPTNGVGGLFIHSLQISCRSARELEVGGKENEESEPGW